MEILNNSIVKLLVRQGSDLDRKQVILESGEFGFTTDQERLFIGNGYLSGGIVVGNRFQGSSNLVTDGSIQPAIVGDFGYSTQNNILYALSANTGSLIDDWKPIGGVYGGSRFINISSANTIILNPLSSYAVSEDLLGNALSLVDGKISFSGIDADDINSGAVQYPVIVDGGKITLSPLSAGYIHSDALSFPLSVIDGRVGLAPLSSYSISQEALSSPLVIRDGKIALNSIPASLVSNKTITVGSGIGAIVDGLPSSGVNMSPLTNTIQIFNTQILLKYNALSGSGSYDRNVISYTTLSAGHYKVVFTPIHDEYIPMVNIVGLDAMDCQARVISTSLSSCDIKILDSAGTTRDANIYLTINF
jgi:hypothetical protein